MTIDENIYIEKAKIFEMAYKFSDAANLVNAELFESLWSPERAEWIMLEPNSATFSGKENMGSALKQMLSSWNFFVQFIAGGVVTLDLENDKAYGRFYVNEQAQSKDGSKGYYNLAMYEDEFKKIDGKWYFEMRKYHFIYMTDQPMKGTVNAVPMLPEKVYELAKKNVDI